MIVVDSSVWIDYFTGKNTPEAEKLDSVLGEAPEGGEFLSHLAVTGNVAASTQNQALNALVFMYKAVLDKPLGNLQRVVRAKKTADRALSMYQEYPQILHGSLGRGRQESIAGATCNGQFIR